MALEDIVLVVREDRHKSPCTVWFHEYEMLPSRQMQRQEAGQWLPGAGEEGGECSQERGLLRGDGMFGN